MNKAIVFCDTDNKDLDTKYAEKVINEFRKQIGWKVLPNTRIHNELLDFSKGYSKIKRNVTEVVMIFCLANGIKMKQVPVPKTGDKEGG